MKIDKLLEVLVEFNIIDRYTIFMCIEGMKALGYNVLNFVIDLGSDIEYSALSLRYMAIDELEPIAIVIQPKKDRAKDLNLVLVSRILHRYGGYLYGGQEGMGFLIPVQEDNLLQIFNNVMPKIIENLFGYTVKPRIVECTLDFYYDVQL